MVVQVWGQDSREYTHASAGLPANERAILDRLGKLYALPDGIWKVHPGDLSHGEAVNLDDSQWPTAKEDDRYAQDAVWFRTMYTVPETLDGYDLTGARIWFQFRAHVDGAMPEIVYFDGRRVALGEALEPIVLTEHAKPGEKIVVAVKLLYTPDDKVFRAAGLHIDLPEGRPNPVDLRQELLAAEELMPVLAPNDFGPAATLHQAITTINIKALNAHDQAKFDLSLQVANAKLAALKPLLQQRTFHLDGDAHIDAAWLWPWTETVDVVKRTFSTALQLMHEYPGYTFTQSAAAYNEWIADKYPDINKEIAQRIKEGRWEMVGGMWVEPDLNMPDGESLVRQLLVGNRWFRQHYGVAARIGWNPDSFGYTWQLPQIYKKSGVDYFITQKISWNDTNDIPFKLFWWESPDGSKVLAYFPRDYGSQNMNPVRLAHDMKLVEAYAPGSTELLDLYGVGDHGGGPTRAMLDEGFHWTGFAAGNAGRITPKYEYGTAQSFFDKIEKQIISQGPEWNYQSIAKGYTLPTAVPGKISIPTWKSELYLEYHRGVFTTQSNHKRNMRESEEELLNAEKWASLAWLDGKNYPGSEITEDWKKVLFNQFHDLAAGSGIGIIYKDAQNDYDAVRWSTNEISVGALNTLAATTDTRGKGIPVVVFNPLGWDRSGNVQVDVRADASNFLVVDSTQKNKSALPLAARVDEKTGIMHLTVYVASVPALGYKVIHLVPGKAGAASGVKASETASAIELGDGKLRVAIDKKSGCITSLEQGGFEMLAKGTCGNELQLFKDQPRHYDAWNIDPGTLDAQPIRLDMADNVELIGADTPQPAIRVTRTWQNSKFVQTITIPPVSGQVDIANSIDWHERHLLLKVAFPLAVTSNFATYEIPYGTIDRATTRNNSWEQAQFEVPAMRWADLGDGKHGLSLINQTKYGYDAVGNLLRLSLLRSSTSPDPEADQGHHEFRYAIYPHDGSWKDALTMRHGWEYDYPLVATSVTAHSGLLPSSHSFISVSPENVVLTAVKKAEDAKGLVFRVYEWAGKTSITEFHVPATATGATVTNMSETPEGAALAVVDNVVKVPIHPYEILTVRVNYPSGGTKE
jgi:alpha-mannosidase